MLLGTLVSERAVKDAPQRADGAVSSEPAPLAASRGFHRNENSAHPAALREAKESMMLSSCRYHIVIMMTFLAAE